MNLKSIYKAIPAIIAATSCSVFPMSVWLVIPCVAAWYILGFDRKVKAKDSTDTLEVMATELAQIASGIEKSTLTLKSKSSSLAENTLSQSKEVSDMREASVASSQSIQDIESHSTDTSTHAKETNETVSSGFETLKQLKRGFDQLKENVFKLGENTQKNTQSLHEINEAVHNITVKTVAIDEIVLQTKLLSFNASIEAARAGESGKGFSVVATEIGNLAATSGSIAKDINEIVVKTEELINNATQKAEEESTLTVKKSKTAVEEGETHLASVISAMESIAKRAEESEHKTADIHESCHALNRRSQSMTENVSNIETSSQSNLEQSKEIQEQLEFFGKHVETLNGLMSGIVGHATGSYIKDINCLETQKRSANHVIVDVRRPEEYNDSLGHIEGSILMTITDDFKDKLASLDRSKPHIFVCRSGGRSARAARIALSEGFKKVFNMEGGMLAWNEQNLPCETINESKAAA